MKKLAIIGTGVAGMACGYYLRSFYDVTYYEKNDYPGGHTNTRMVAEKGREIPVDTGFIVYNEVTYPNLIRFFEELKIPTKPTSMSFSVQHLPSGLEYCGSGLNELFAQRRNLFRPAYWKMLMEIGRFNRECLEVLSDPTYETWTVERYADEKNFGNEMRDKYLLPMSAAIWSTEARLMLKFPIVTLVNFFKNHGLLGLTGHYQWRTVDGGSRVYRDRVMESFKGKVRLSNPAVQVIREEGKVWILDALSRKESYDAVILASHADQSLSLLKQPTEAEKNLLGAFRYQKNHVQLHTDTVVMPKKKITWSSWNYRMGHRSDGSDTTLIYWMNRLQQVSDRENYFVSVNDPQLIDPQKMIWQTEYEHPVFDVKAIEAQAHLPQLNDSGPVYFCGSYFRFGFHEDAFTSALRVVQKLTGKSFGYLL